MTGEIMIVHVCTACGAISCNRVAGDDNPFAVINILNELETIESIILDNIKKKRIDLLSPDDEPIVGTALLGRNYKAYME